MTKQINIQEILDTFTSGVTEVTNADLKKFVVAIETDGTPLREQPGGTLKLFGGRIWSTAFTADAAMVAATINKQLKGASSETRVHVEHSEAWKTRRIEKLHELREQIEEHLRNNARTPEAKPLPMLTKLERKALKAALWSAARNGNDFGFTEDIVKKMRGESAQAVGAIVTSLQSKGFFTVHKPVVTNDGGRHNTFHQFTWDMPVADITALVG